MFIDEDDGSGDNAAQVRGYSIDVWNEIADRIDYQTEWVIYDSVGEIIDAAAASETDVAIAGISMTVEREAVIDFSHPYFDSGLQIVTTGEDTSSTIGALWGLATGRAVVIPFVILVGLVLLISHLVWFTERRTNPQFPHGYREGIGEALWWSSVSVITGGEAVKEINRPLTRVLALFWMVVGLVLLAYVTAQAASSLTVRELQGLINGIDDLSSANVVTVEGTVAETFLAEQNINADGVADIDTALQLLDAGEYDAAVYDSPVLAYRASTDYSGRIEVVGSVFAPDPYGIALSPGSELREPINAALLTMSRDGTLDELHLKWFDQLR